MTTQVLNFLWLNLDLPAKPDPKFGPIRAPMPPEYIDNIRKAGGRHPDADIVLWVDSKRLTEKQMAYLKNAIEDGLPNVKLKDLRSIPAYDSNELYNKGERSKIWRKGSQTSLIWRQVDCAKILISLQGDYDQTFFSDMDRSHVDIASKPVQDRLKKIGMLFGSMGEGSIDIENQLWGFKRERRRFFEEYYYLALRCAAQGDNAFIALRNMTHTQLVQEEGFWFPDYCLPIKASGPPAYHPGQLLGSSGHDPFTDLASFVSRKATSLKDAWKKATGAKAPTPPQTAQKPKAPGEAP